jgi:hypothetical protein
VSPWNQYKAIRDANRIDTANYMSLPPDACPYDGTPLEVGYITVQGGAKELRRNCPMGDYSWSGGPRLM